MTAQWHGFTDVEDVPRYVEVVTVREDSTAPSAETTAVRLVGLLPPHWRCVPEVAGDRVRLWIERERGTSDTDIRRRVREVLADTALRGWTEQR
ncbi:hypothetical protein GCM10011583_47440 [Streptomyces camponoticapitis]|uniref:Uncharacterized protein n=1 Tax=Streptomyces camponoticapitis TaxID=1616125 RepID=A0ABQ2EJF8_9ACTN|nr:hypothetical protein [Streptomyces camponoticapitis]GGK09796.1 hypothetical protein GCM10011583_47440 [Streptomyces camponoticapitis]